MGARLLKSSISISSLITWPNELKLCRVILDIGAHSRSVPDFAISFQGALWEAHLLKSSNRYTAHSSHPIELKLGRMIPDINLHNRSELDFSISFQEALQGRGS